MSNYLEDLLSGRALIEDFDDYVSSWHAADASDPIANMALHEYLGLSWEDYRLAIEHPSSMRFIVAAKRANQSVQDVLTAVNASGVAARSEDFSEAQSLLAWLQKTGRVKSVPRFP